MKNKLGMNLLLWGTEMPTDLFPVLEMIKSTGFDTVEVPILNTDIEHWHKWRAKLDELGLSCVAETINGPQENAISADASVRKAALEFNKRVIDCAEVLGSQLLIGPFHSGLGAFTGEPATTEEKKWAKEHLWQLAEYASDRSVTLGLEYLNRFESYLVSCTDELLELVNDVNHPACKVMFDTFHANIEEKNIAEGIKKIGNQLVHVQLSENDRGTLGAGHINFKPIIDVLNEIGYKGVISVEAFSTELKAANIWRKMFENEEQLTKDSYAFLKSIMN